MPRSRTTLFLCTLMIAALAVGGCNTVVNTVNTVTGSENYITESRNVSGFTGVKLEGSGVVVIEKGDTESLTVETDDNIMPLIVTEVQNGVLRLGFKENTSVNTKRLMFRITAREVNDFEIFGSGTVSMGVLNTSSVRVLISGSGTVSLIGSAAQQDIQIDGSGTFEGTNLDGQQATVTINGMGNVVVNVTDALNVRIDGAGSVSYGGNPRVTKEINGVGTVTQRTE